MCPPPPQSSSPPPEGRGSGSGAVSPAEPVSCLRPALPHLGFPSQPHTHRTARLLAPGGSFSMPGRPLAASDVGQGTMRGEHHHGKSQVFQTQDGGEMVRCEPKGSPAPPSSQLAGICESALFGRDFEMRGWCAWVTQVGRSAMTSTCTRDTQGRGGGHVAMGAEGAEQCGHKRGAPGTTGS